MTMPAYQADVRPAPADLGRWNWGAFLLNWIWGIGNNVWIALLIFVPVIGWVMPFVLGFKGNEWAWRNGRWDSIGHFQRVQRNWAIAGVIFWLALIAVIFSIVGSVFYALKSSDVYAMAQTRIESSVEAANALGKPMSFGFPSGSVSTQGQGGLAALTFSASGPKASGQIAVAAVREKGVWRLEKLALRIDGDDQTIDLLQGARAGLAPDRFLRVALRD